MQDIEEGGLALECISARLVKVRQNLKGVLNGISVVVAYVQTDGPKSVRDKNLFRATLDSTVAEVPNKEHLRDGC